MKPLRLDDVERAPLTDVLQPGAPVQAPLLEAKGHSVDRDRRVIARLEAEPW